MISLPTTSTLPLTLHVVLSEVDRGRDTPPPTGNERERDRERREDRLLRASIRSRLITSLAVSCQSLTVIEVTTTVTSIRVDSGVAYSFKRQKP